MDWRSVVAIIVGVDSICILARHASALALVNCAGPLVVVHMAKENQIHLLPKYVKQTASCILNMMRCSVIFYLVVEQEWLHRGNKVWVHAGNYAHIR